jgi:hypothetical protein
MGSRKPGEVTSRYQGKRYTRYQDVLNPLGEENWVRSRETQLCNKVKIPAA